MLPIGDVAPDTKIAKDTGILFSSARWQKDDHYIFPARRHLCRAAESSWFSDLIQDFADAGTRVTDISECQQKNNASSAQNMTSNVILTLIMTLIYANIWRVGRKIHAWPGLHGHSEANFGHWQHWQSHDSLAKSKGRRQCRQINYVVQPGAIFADLSAHGEH